MRATAKYGWKVVGVWMGSVLVYAVLCIARIVPAEALCPFVI